MREQPALLSELLELTRWLGAKEQDCAILGEGNSSARVGSDSFLVKASGYEMGTIDERGFVEVSLSRALAMLGGAELDDDSIRQGLLAAKVDPQDPRLPSIETVVHAVCLACPGVSFVGHSHPTAINAITCARDFNSVLAQPLFPDQIVVCGPEPLLVPYADPGIPLAQAIQAGLTGFIKRCGAPPRAIYLQNHGFVALGKSAKQVRAITAMAVKGARILAGTASFGGPLPMRPDEVERIHSRSDEHYRQKIIENN